MMNKVETPEGAGSSASPQGSAKGPGPSKAGPLGYGNGPLLTAGVMVSGALLFAGWGAVQMAIAEDSPENPPSVSAPATPGTEDESPDDGGSSKQGGEVTVTLPDKDGNGVADALEDKDDDKQPGRDGGDTGRTDEDETGETEPKASVYTIQEGDTLSEISGETGVPVDILVEENRIQNPNLIYAGASLLIPPVG